MRVKVFTSKGPFNGIVGRLRQIGKNFYGMEYVQTLEDQINRWLAENPAVTVVRTEQSLSGKCFGQPHCMITLWYEPARQELTRQAAEQLVLDRLRQDHPMNGNTDTIAITEVIERPFGWVFCFNSKSFVETGDARKAMLGNYPILVDRFKCTFHDTGIEPLETYVQRYERTGTTRAEPGAAREPGPALPV